MKNFSRTYSLLRFLFLSSIIGLCTTCNPDKPAGTSRQEVPGPEITGDLSHITIGMSAKTLNAPYFITQLTR